MLRHAVAVLDFIEGEGARASLEGEAVRSLVAWLLEGTTGYEEAAPLVQRLRDIAQTHPQPCYRFGEEVMARSYAVRLAARRTLDARSPCAGETLPTLTEFQVTLLPNLRPPNPTPSTRKPKPEL